MRRGGRDQLAPKCTVASVSFLRSPSELSQAFRGRFGRRGLDTQIVRETTELAFERSSGNACSEMSHT